MSDALPDYEPPEGLVYEWKVTHVKGDLVTVDLDGENSGWRPVPSDRHEVVEAAGCRLMECETARRDAFLADILAQSKDLQLSAIMGSGQPEVPHFSRVSWDRRTSFPNLSHVLTESGWEPIEVVRAREKAADV